MWITREELIKQLQELPKGSLICATQSGYYAEGLFADIDIVKYEYDNVKNLYSISHSHQSY